MSATDNFTTPDKKRKPSSPPSAPLKKRQKENQPEPGRVPMKEDALLLISVAENGEVVTYCSNHPVLGEISGHFGDLLQFYTDELFESVLGVVGGNGYSATNRQLCFAEEIRKMMKESLMKLFSQEIYGGGVPEEGQLFRGTIVL